MRDFERWLDEFRPSIATYEYYVDFDKVHANVQAIKVPLHILNSLVGAQNIRSEFMSLVHQYPETLECIPILLAKREKEIYCADEKGGLLYNFTKAKKDMTAQKPEQYAYFMEKTGLFDLLQNRIVSNLFDYVTGIETGLDSNGRKNRGGHLMEDLVESFIVHGGFVKGETYFKEMYLHEITDKWGLDMGKISNEGRSEKRFDFVVKTPIKTFLIEVNFYTSGGSKLNEVARSYSDIAPKINSVPGFEFVWITDGIGWKSARNKLQEAFVNIPSIYNLTNIDDFISIIKR